MCVYYQVGHSHKQEHPIQPDNLDPQINIKKQ
jgi:hypothetical protein